MDWKKAHFIGIGGVGMSATAKLLKDVGVVVTGSDEEVYSPISTFLQKESFDVRMPYAASNIPEDADLIIIGKNARLVPETNVEVAAAYASGKKILSFPEVLASLSKDKESVVVAGSYGKSTSTALLAHVLESAGLDPSYFIGASPLTPATSARMGSGNLFVLEGDEYPASNTDPRSKFLLLNPQHVLLTPLAHDHFNIFPTPADYLKPFYELAKLVPTNGTFVACVEGPLSKEFLQNISREVVTYGVHEGEFRAASIAWGEKTSFTLMHGETSLVKVETSQLGEHSIQNIVGVAAFVFSLNVVTPGQFVEAVASFKGIRRRLDKKSEKTSVPIFEGFGSSYDKMKSAIAAMKRHFATRRLLVVFEPNTIGWRSRTALSQYDDVFVGAAEVYIFNPPHDGKATEVNAQEIAQRVSESGITAKAFDNAEDVLTEFQKELVTNDCILLSSSGAMGGLIESIPKLAEQKFPA
jgi:UDP-N-acetylmuramate: L-alanyl-gamma-D-glutamyl-meso-diaminopimelate ligase